MGQQYSDAQISLVLSGSDLLGGLAPFLATRKFHSLPLAAPRPYADIFLPASSVGCFIAPV